MSSASLTLAALWFVWLLSWFLASGWTGTTVAQQTPGSRIAQSLPIWIGAVLLVRTPSGPLATPLYSQGLGIAWVMVVAAAVCFAFTWWARIHLGRLWSAAVTLKAEHTIVRSGPYGITRHPIYTGMLGALLATALFRNTVVALIGFGLILAGLYLKLREEERFLSGRFGAAYDAYKRDVPALVPRPW